MTRRNRLSLTGLLVAAPSALGQGQVWIDPVDAVLHRADQGNNGAVPASAVLPDLVRASVCTWFAPDPFGNPYSGQCMNPGATSLFRLELVFDGLVNPPGTIGVGTPFDPYQYGPSPLYGFFGIDIDNNIDSGGEFTSQAIFRYPANVARFGGRPAGLLGPRVAVKARDYFLPDPLQPATWFASQPWIERSGADSMVTLCGCWPTSIEKFIAGNTNTVFEAGETWVVRGRFFQRISGYACIGGSFGGSGPGQYDPWVNARFSHNALSDQTTVTLVYALDQAGAGQLMGLPQEPPLNFSAGDATSIHEGLNDIDINAAFALGDCRTLTQAWIPQVPTNYLNPNTWTVHGLFGTSYSAPEPGVHYAWTDSAFETRGDVNGDGARTLFDRAVVLARIAQLDGTADDCDPTPGRVGICNYGVEFDLHDVTGDGAIGPLDIAFFCPVDFNGDGILTLADFSAFQNAWQLGDMRADFNLDGFLTIADFPAFQAAFGIGCL